MNIESLPGKILQNQYLEIDFFKRGGMGEIYKCVDSINNEIRALKLISVENDEEYSLLKSEFEITYSLSHKNVVGIEYFNEIVLKGVKYL